MRYFALAIGLGATLVASPAGATTWDEPWHEKVVQGADAFAKVEVKKLDASHAEVHLVRPIVGATLPVDFVIDDFYALELHSLSTPVELDLSPGLFYVFVKTSKRTGGFAIATPTSGFAAVSPSGEVIGTFRHSYHLGKFPEPLYADAQRAIFSALHQLPVDTAFTHALYSKWLGQPPGTSGDGTFFAQHAAMETMFHTRAAGEDPDTALGVLRPFLASQGYHEQVSAVRATSALGTAAANLALMDFVEATHSNFAKVIALWGLERNDARMFRDRLAAYSPNAPTTRTGFGGDIMDPRVGTSFPSSVKDAVDALVAKWTPAKPVPAPSTASTPPPPGIATRPPNTAGCGGCAVTATEPSDLLGSGLALPLLLALRMRRRA